MKRLGLPLLTCLLLLFAPAISLAAIADVGLKSPVHCTDIPNPVIGKTWCFQQSDGFTYVYTGTDPTLMSSWTRISPSSIPVPTTQGGTGADTSGSTGLPSLLGGAWSVTGGTGTPHLSSGVLAIGTVQPEPSDYADLPATCTDNQLVAVTDNIRGVWKCKGNAWHSITGYADPSDWAVLGDSTYAAAYTGAPGTDNATALNTMFSTLRALNSAVKVHFGPGKFLIKSSVDMGGWGLDQLVVEGSGGQIAYGNTTIICTMTGGVCLDFSASEGVQVRDIELLTGLAATFYPDVGMLFSTATPAVGDHTSATSSSAGADTINHVRFTGSTNIAALAMQADDETVGQCNFWNYGTAGGSQLYVTGGGTHKTYTLTSAFRTLNNSTGLTSFTSWGNYFAGSNAHGGDMLAEVVIDSSTGMWTSTGDAWTNGFAGPAILAINNNGLQIRAVGFRQEGSSSFLKTDGVINSYLLGNPQNLGGGVPIIDLDSAYGSRGGVGVIGDSEINMTGDNSGAYLFNTSAAGAGITNNLIHLGGRLNLTLTGAQANGNFFFKDSSGGTITLRTSAYDTNLVMNSNGLAFLYQGVTGQPIRQTFYAYANLDFAAWSGGDCQTLTVSVPGAVDGDQISLGTKNALGSIAGVLWDAWVSSTDTVSVRGCKITAGASADPASTLVAVRVWRTY